MPLQHDVKPLTCSALFSSITYNCGRQPVRPSDGRQGEQLPGQPRRSILHSGIFVTEFGATLKYCVSFSDTRILETESREGLAGSGSCPTAGTAIRDVKFTVSVPQQQ